MLDAIKQKIVRVVVVFCLVLVGNLGCLASDNDNGSETNLEQLDDNNSSNYTDTQGVIWDERYIVPPKENKRITIAAEKKRVQKLPEWMENYRKVSELRIGRLREQARRRRAEKQAEQKKKKEKEMSDSDDEDDNKPKAVTIKIPKSRNKKKK